MNVVRRLLSLKPAGDASSSVHFVHAGSGWLMHNLREPRFSPPKPIDADRIEARAVATERMGAKPLWEGYAAVTNYPRATAESRRRSDEVRSSSSAGRLFAWLAAHRVAPLIVEFGTAFGVSGMYWLAGLKRDPKGRLLTFEPNALWAEIARENLAAISPQFDLVTGTFEECIDSSLLPGQRIDIAFVDAIHTSECVLREFEILLPRMTAGGLILFDDIGFSADMESCWHAIARDPRVVASATFGGRLGIVEL
ncbi:MAG: class I SAM-dependent methyltransferase [Rhodospirillales bacterium]|nr:class I SAM-dependent methyltransferase [Rhodospirillales bacterium]